MKGYIKDYRQELQSDIWMMPPLYHRVWQYLKYQVNHEPKKIPMRDGSFLQIKKGQHLTSIRNIAEGVSWYERGKRKEPNPKTVNDVLDWLIKQGMIEIERGKGNRQYTLITLINWEVYQSSSDESNSKVTENKQSLDINKNEKNDKKDITTTEKDPVDLIADKYSDLRTIQEGRPAYPKTSDYQSISVLVNQGYPIDRIIGFLEQCFTDYEQRNPNGKISSFKYCEKYIIDHIETLKAKEAAKNEAKGDSRFGSHKPRANVQSPAGTQSGAKVGRIRPFKRKTV